MTQQLSLHPADRRGASAAALVDEEASPTRTTDQAKQMFALLLVLAITSVAVAEFCGLIPVAWLAVGPLLGSLVLSPRITAVLAGWSVLLGLGLTIGAPQPTGGLASHLGDMALLAVFAVANAVLLTALQRRTNCSARSSPIPDASSTTTPHCCCWK